jgi:hypothetical protein
MIGCFERCSGAFGAMILASLALAPPALPHTHVDSDGREVSWYPMECCNAKDCRPVASIQRSSHGLWLTTVDGFTVLIGPNQYRRPSLDLRWHVCIGRDETEPDTTTKIMCVFEPPQS